MDGLGPVICESCGFPPGYRTGEVHDYVYRPDRDVFRVVALCDDCVRHSDDVTRSNLMRTSVALDTAASLGGVGDGGR